MFSRNANLNYANCINASFQKVLLKFNLCEFYVNTGGSLDMRIRVMRLPFIHFMQIFPRTKMSISRGLPALVLDGGCSPNHHLFIHL